MKQGAIFDMDGTLFDTERLYWNAWIETADVFGVERKPELAAAMSGSNFDSMPGILKKYHPTVDAEKYIWHVINTVRAKIEEELVIKPGVKEILEYFLENKVDMAIASSSETHVIEKNVKRVGLEKYFDVLVGGEQVSRGKPNPDIFLKAAEEIHLDPTDCYVFEDSINGVRAGAAANSATIMVIDCVEPSEEIRKLCAGVYADMNEALAAIQRGEI